MVGEANNGYWNKTTTYEMSNYVINWSTEDLEIVQNTQVDRNLQDTFWRGGRTNVTDKPCLAYFKINGTPVSYTHLTLPTKA